MKKLSGREKCICAALAAAVTAAVCYSFERTVVHGVLSWTVRQTEYAEMLFELAVLFFLFVLIGRFAKTMRARAIGIGAVAAVFLWIHVILLPVLAAGLYLLWVCLLGNGFRRLLNRTEQRETDIGRDFLAGSLTVICLFCLMSALGIGSIPWLWTAVGITAAVLLLTGLCSGRKSEPRRLWKDGALQESRWSAPQILGTAFVLTVFCMQAGRMNIAIDYDTMWYGARAPYILDNGRGIYENLGTVGVVYTYSKGWEILTLPLAILPSYSFLTAVNWWMAAGVLWTAWRAARYFMNRRAAACLTVFLTTVPGILNMTLSAKTDMGTLLVQLLMILEILRVIDSAGGKPAAGQFKTVAEGSGGETERGALESGGALALVYSLAAFLLSLTFKPTALVFSTAVYGMSGLYLLYIRGIPKHCPQKRRREAAAVVILAVLELAMVWARTLLLTGLPVTSVFTSVFTRLGFRLKYPYPVKPIPDSGGSLSLAGKFLHLAERVYGFVLNPDVSDDLGHVIVAWGGPVIWFAVCAAAALLLFRGRRRGRGEKLMDGWLAAVCLPFLAVCVVCLYLLQVLDGNYFMLLYVLLALAEFRLAARLENPDVRRRILCLSLPLMVFSALFMTMTDWSWSLGLSPVDPVNRGYYDHRELRHAEMAAEGKGTAWAILAQDPRNRVIVLGDHPLDLAFPCSAQSYTDIVGSDGNVELVKYMDRFVEFMDWAKTDYVFLNAGWTADRARAWELTYYLIEYGHLTPVCYEKDNMLAEVSAGGDPTPESERQAADFLRWKEQYLGG